MGLEPASSLGMLTFLLRDIEAFEGFFTILEYYNRTGAWPAVPEVSPVEAEKPEPQPLYYAQSKVAGLSVRDDGGKLVRSMLLGERMEVWEEVAALGGWKDRAVITSPGESRGPRLNVWRASIRKEE